MRFEITLVCLSALVASFGFVNAAPVADCDPCANKNYGTNYADTGYGRNNNYNSNNNRGSDHPSERFDDHSEETRNGGHAGGLRNGVSHLLVGLDGLVKDVL